MESIIEKATILVVDDNPTNVKLVCNILKTEGYNLAVAMNGQDALEIVESNPIDLILLDIMMPGMDGYEVCQKLKASEFYCDIPVIFISALSDMDDITKSYDVGGADFITKPVKEREVISRVRTQLELVSTRKELERAKLAEKDEDDDHEEDSIIKENFMKSLLPTDEHFKKYFSDSFVFCHSSEAYPSGFHWLHEHNEYVLLVMIESPVKDIPAVSFNVIGLTLLNQLPIQGFSDMAKDVLNHLLPSYIKTLNQFGFESLNEENFSIGVVAYNRNSKVMQYSGSGLKCMVYKGDNEHGALNGINCYTNNGETGVNTGLRIFMLPDGNHHPYHDNLMVRLKEIQNFNFSEQEALLKKELLAMENGQGPHGNFSLIGIEFGENDGSS
ncbi:MAG: response regulator [Bacteroidetes bacterium]|nr:response regulator [Bacteroidota bacterium]